jgi:hypothetical protein
VDLIGELHYFCDFQWGSQPMVFIPRCVEVKEALCKSYQKKGGTTFVIFSGAPSETHWVPLEGSLM